MEWQPIETAPRDGTQIIVLDADGQCGVAEYYIFSDGSSGWEVGHFENGIHMILDAIVTHWMPLPPLPNG